MANGSGPILSTMNLRLILPASAAIFLAASCTPYVEPPPQAPADPAVNKQTEEEKAKIAEQREKKKKAADELTKKEKTEEGAATPDGPAAGGNPDPDKTDTKKPDKKEEVKTARAVPGRPGMVFSPFNNKIVDVTGIPSGRLVADPTYPASEKKHFRVP